MGFLAAGLLVRFPFRPRPCHRPNYSACRRQRRGKRRKKNGRKELKKRKKRRKKSVRVVFFLPPSCSLRLSLRSLRSLRPLSSAFPGVLGGSSPALHHRRAVF